jgi:hypothetical protein
MSGRGNRAVTTLPNRGFKEVSMKTAILVLSGPMAGKEALSHVFKALAAAHRSIERGEEVRVLCLGAGTRWVHELSQTNNPAHGLLNLVKGQVAGIFRVCSEVFGAADGVQASELGFVNDNPTPATAGMPRVSRLMEEAFTVLVYRQALTTGASQLRLSF